MHTGVGNLSNEAGAVYDLQGDAAVGSDAVGDTFLNRGTLRKSGGTGTSSVQPTAFTNDGGTFDVQSGSGNMIQPTAKATARKDRNTKTP